MDPTKVIIPPLKDLNIENITDNVILINSQNPDARLKYVLERLVTHLHDFARETRLSEREWMAGLQFLTATGQTCTDVRQVCKHQSYPLYLRIQEAFDAHMGIAKI
jgi:Catechol dioxygenase N terminus